MQDKAAKSSEEVEGMKRNLKNLVFTKNKEKENENKKVIKWRSKRVNEKIASSAKGQGKEIKSKLLVAM